MPILTKSGRVAIAESIALRPVHIAWGLGDGAWLTAPSENPNALALQEEIGRRTANNVGFVVADPVGDIILPTGRFTRSVTPTNMLLVEVSFDFSDASSSVIREFAVFVGTEVVAGLPEGQRYFVPSEVSNPGRVLHLENSPPIFRSPEIRPGFKIVVVF